MSELTGLDLRKAACEAMGWEVIEDQFLQNDTQRLTGIGRRFGRGTTEALPAIESDSAVSESMLQEFCNQGGYYWALIFCTYDNPPTPAPLPFGPKASHYRCDIGRRGGLEVASAEGATPSEARARAIVTAKGKR